MMGNLMNAAAAIGLGSCWINRAKEEFETEEGKALLKKWGIEGRLYRCGPLHSGLPGRGTPARRPPQAGLYRIRIRSTMKPDYKLVAKAKYIHANADLASEIWHEVYKRYYPAKQLDTLVETLQSADAIEADIDNDVNYFLVVLGGKTIGYFAWKMENTALHLLHLYLKPEYRGKALGRDILATCERLARGEGRGRLYCERARQVPCRCCSSLRPRATACWAPPRQEAARRFQCSFEPRWKKCCKFPVDFLPRLHYNKVVY